MNLRKLITGEDKLPPRIIKSLEETGKYEGMSSGIIYIYTYRGGKIIRQNLITGKCKFYHKDGYAFGEKKAVD